LLGNALLLGNAPGRKSWGVVQPKPKRKARARKIRARASRTHGLEFMSMGTLRTSEQVTKVPVFCLVCSNLFYICFLVFLSFLSTSSLLPWGTRVPTTPCHSNSTSCHNSSTTNTSVRFFMYQHACGGQP